MLAALEVPFAAGYLEQVRRGTACVLAAQISPQAALPWVAGFEPHVPWTRSFLELRAQTYQALDHRLAGSAAVNLTEFQRNDDARW